MNTIQEYIELLAARNEQIASCKNVFLDWKPN